MVIFMFRTGRETILRVFQSKFIRITHTYPTRFRKDQKIFKLNQTKFQISLRGLRLQNKVLRPKEKNILFQYIFKNKTKERTFHLQNEIHFI